MAESNVRRRRGGPQPHEVKFPAETLAICDDLRRTEDPDVALSSKQPELHSVTSYATKTRVPYRRDNDSPMFNGAQGVVYKANVTDGLYATRAFAVKEIHLSGARERTNLENEIKHLRKCDHPNVLKLHEAFKIEENNWANIYFLVTEPWADTSFERFFKDLGSSRTGTSSSYKWHDPNQLSPWPSIVRQCLLGLQHLHKNLIRHKDLKPGNILLLDESSGGTSDPRIRVIIADLGISKASTPGAPTSFVGTKEYMAPEQLAGESSTTKSDIFSLGACFAMIQAVLCSQAGLKPWMRAKQNQEGFFAVDKMAEGRFAPNANRILAVLEQLRQEQEDRCDALGCLFRSTLQRMVRKMFTTDPLERPGIDDIYEILEDYERIGWKDVATRNVTPLQTSTSSIFHRPDVKLEKSFDARNLERISGIKVKWTDNLADHLRMSEDDTIVEIFHPVSQLHQRAILDSSSKGDILRSQTPTTLSPELVDETIRTLALLLPERSEKVKRWFEAQARLQKKQNITLDLLARQCGQLTWEERQIKNFGYWRDRIEILKQAFDEHEPVSLMQWWRGGRRNWTERFTLQIVTVSTMFSLLFGFLCVVISLLQLYWAYQYTDLASRT